MQLDLPEAVVLRRVDVGEAHRLVEVISPTHGLMTALARGARASRRRFAGSLEMFATLALSLQRRGLTGDFTVQGADPLALRLGLRGDYDAMVRAGSLSRCARALSAPGQAAPRLYYLLSRALDACATQRVADAALCYPYLLKAAGLLPKVACVRCHATASPLGLSTHDGCLFCLGCLKTARPLPGEVLQGLRCALRPPVDEGTARALEACVLHMVGIHLGKRLPQPEYLAKRALRANSSGPKASSQYG